MKLTDDLRQRHLTAWTRALREFKPADVENIQNLPEIEFDDVSVKAAIKAGWFEDATDPATVDDMKAGEVNKLSGAIWKAFNAARRIDPN
jgi:hypothetical protein